MKKILILLILTITLITFGCKQSQLPIEKDTIMEENKAGVMIKKDTMINGYNGALLSGSETKYLDFNKNDYDKSLSEGKTILLYFYANWCPLCKEEQVETISAFNELSFPNFIGFRVNYKDSDTDKNEEELAKEFGISYQHTKVIIKNGERILKAPDSWDKERYIQEISKVA